MRAWIRFSSASSPMQGHGHDCQGQGRDDGQGDLAAVDVAEESHRQRDRLHELEEELDDPDVHGQQPGPDAVAELADREELAEVAAHAQLPEALALEEHERGQGQADGDVDVAGGRPQLVDLADRRHQAAPVENRISMKKAAKIG